MSAASIGAARAAKAKALATLGRETIVVGIGITRIGEGYGVKINLSMAPGEGLDLPADIDGVPVRLEVVGAIGKRPRE